MDNTKSMPKDKKEAWLKALRSGDYKQGEGLLYSSFDGSFCCLGVYCDAVIDIHERDKIGDIGPITLNCEWISDLPDSLTTDVPEILMEPGGVDGTITEKLSMMNDDRNPAGEIINNFDVIADWIDANIEGI